MKLQKISNIKNILIYGDVSHFQVELKALNYEGLSNISVVNQSEMFCSYLKNNIVDLIIFDALEGPDEVAYLLKNMYSRGLTNVPMILFVDHETIDGRYEYFNIGITNFYERGEVSLLIDLVKHIDREETYRKRFKNMTIAILDDDKLQLKMLKDILGRNGISQVDTFGHPQDLLTVKKTYDIYLIDLILPEIDGEIVMYEIRKINEHAIIIGISSIEKHSTIAKVLAIGANDYLVKPISSSVFMAKLYNYGKNLLIRKENESKTRVLKELACKDGLTSLYNHRYIQELLSKHAMQAKRHNRPLSVMMLDIDNFKMINDQYGHPFGDVILSDISSILLRSVRDHDLIGRYGGEEFVIILPDTTDLQGLIIGERIRYELLQYDFMHHLDVTVSGGIASLESDVEQLIYDADCLMYDAKRTGKNKILIKENVKENIQKYETC